MYAEAKIAFETVLRFDNLPPDLESQARIYARAAESYLEEGSRLLGFGYAATGIGQYRVNSTRGTNALGGGDRRDTFYNARVGGGLNYDLQDNYALDASLDYRFRYYDNPDSRNDSDLRWRAAGSRAFGENNLALGVRGRTSYRGNGNHRNDYGLFTDYRYRLDPDNQLTTGAELRRRRYPEALPNRSFSSAVANIGWVHALGGGDSSISLVAHGGYNFATNRPDGDSVVYGLTATYDFTITKTLGWLFVRLVGTRFVRCGSHPFSSGRRRSEREPHPQGQPVRGRRRVGLGFCAGLEPATGNPLHSRSEQCDRIQLQFDGGLDQYPHGLLTLHEQDKSQLHAYGINWVGKTISNFRRHYGY